MAIVTALRRFARFYASGLFAKFLFAGGLAAAVNFASRPVFQAFVGFNDAVALSYLVGFLTAFFLNRAFVFPRSGKALRVEMAWFLLFNVIAFPVVIGAAIGLRAFLFAPVLPPSWAEAAAHGCAIMVPVVFNFAAHRLVTFRAHDPHKTPN